MISIKNEKQYTLNQIYFYLTEGCNLKCCHCWIDPKYQSLKESHSYLNHKVFSSVINQAKNLGLSGVKLSGGEPFLHPDILHLLDIVKSEKLILTIESNGVLCTDQISDKIKQCINPFVCVSLDGANSKTHETIRGVKGCFSSTLLGIKRLVERGIKVQLIMSIMRLNSDQIEDFITLAETLNVFSVKFNIVQPTARGKFIHNSYQNLPVNELIELGKWVENYLDNKTYLEIFYDQPPAFRPLDKLLKEDISKCGVCGILGIIGVLSNGSYALCGIGTTVEDLVFGHAEKDDLHNIWYKSKILNALRHGLPERLNGICKNCLVKGICLGSCIAQNYYTTHNIWSSFWFCEEAKKMGIFPKNRLSPIISN